MTTRGRIRLSLAAFMVVVLSVGIVIAWKSGAINKRHVVAYFANSTGVFVGDDVRILGVPVGKIDRIEPQGTHVKISLWYDEKYLVPATAKAVIISPSLVPMRAIQLTPAYTDGPTLADHAVIDQDRTAVPVEWDDLRDQLEKLTAALQPTEPGGVSTFGSLINTAADNLRGRGATIRKSIIALSQAFSSLGNHSDDIFATVKNLSILVSALRDSTSVIRELNQHLATATGLLSNNPDEIGRAVRAVNGVVGDMQRFVAANREALGTASDKLASISTAVVQSLDDLKQTLHLSPNTVQNFVNIYQPATGALAGQLVMNMFANPITFVCGAIQAASRLNAEQAAKLCVQYLAPIVKNRQINFPPLGMAPFVGAMARPNELTFSEDWLRPDYTPVRSASEPATVPGSMSEAPPLPAEARPNSPAVVTAPPQDDSHEGSLTDGLRGLMTPAGS